ncbi:uncharacterized protein PV09_02868 [Verruconis gallopava]|uniref:BTB domain-containing protein n=1 Tax=Verruconis gallopava TaxID=253628 RepID=A0A0D1Z0C2_9PEZI|nr:uncharacterized protein PV09_02868 [Verruconis gallopava]KIW06417.1 hypothetical protein PV09_02868 [Verruconis gallopava]
MPSTLTTMALTNGVHVSGETEHSPEGDLVTSPYTSRAISVKIGSSNASYTILQAHVDQYPALKAHMNQKKADAPIELPDVDEEVAHTLIHFIYTQQYQSLGLGGIPENVRAKAEFKRSILAYFAARLCEISTLEVLTKEKMEHFSKRISIYDVQEIITSVATKLPKDDIWFPEHLYRWVKGILRENDTIVSQERLLNVVGKCPLFDKALFKSVAEMYCEQAAVVNLLTRQESGPQAADSAKKTETAEDDLKVNGQDRWDEQVSEQAERFMSEESHVEEQGVPNDSSETNLELNPTSAESQAGNEDLAVKGVENGQSQPDEMVVPLKDSEAVGSDEHGSARDDESTKIEVASKEDSEVEAALLKANLSSSSGKKKKTKKKKAAATGP